MRVALALALALALSACGSDRPKPTPLETVAAQRSVTPAWQARVGKVGAALRPSVRGGRVVVADEAGEVAAFEMASGRVLWRLSAGAPLAAGVGDDGQTTAVVSQDNDLIVMNEARVLWRHRLGARVVTPPLVAGGRVFVMMINRVVQAFDAADGLLLWTYDRPGDALTLQQPGVLTAFGNTLLAGQGPRLAGIEPGGGTLAWEAIIATPRGTNEVERLGDLVGPSTRVGNQVCLRAFQSSVGCVDATRGTVQWTRNVGGWQSVAADGAVVVGADATDRVTAWRALTGEALWTSEKLAHRALGGAAVAANAAVFGDGEGYLHFLDLVTGSPVLRLATDGSPLAGAPLVVSGLLIVTTRQGGVFAFRLP